MAVRHEGPGHLHTAGPHAPTRASTRGHDIFRPPAFASRSSFARRGVGPSSRSAYRPSGRTSTGFPRSARTSSDRGGRPLYPGDGGAHPDRWRLTAGACRFAAAGPCTRPHVPPAGARLTRHQRGFKPFARPVFPSLWPPGWIGPPLGSRLGLRTPPTRESDNARRGGGQAIEHGPGTTVQLTFSVDLQSGSSLNTCDLASHVAITIHRGGLLGSLSLVRP